MSNDSKRQSENDLKIIDKIKVKIKPDTFENNKTKNAQVQYVHKILDKLIEDLNEVFVPKLDGVLNSNKDSITKLDGDLGTEKSKLDGLITSVGNSDKGLIKDLNDLKSEVESLKEGSIGDDEVGGWQAPQFKGVDTEFI